MRPSPRAAAVVIVVAVAACGPSEVCKRYVACQKAVDPSVDTAPWEDGSACWTTLQNANACSEQCRVALDALAALDDAPAACASEGAETDAGPG